jgi:hypothetical protein
LLRNIRRGKPDTAIDDLHLSPGAKSLLHNLLHLDPQKRMSCKEAAEHYWVREKGVASHADALGEFIFIFGNLLAIFWQWSVWAIVLTSCFVYSVDGCRTDAGVRNFRRGPPRVHPRGVRDRQRRELRREHRRAGPRGGRGCANRVRGARGRVRAVVYGRDGREERRYVSFYLHTGN